MNSFRLNVIFVDDEPRLLDGIRRQLRDHRDTWDMRFASSGTEALALLKQRPCDIIVTDMRMPGMTGGQLLQQVRVLYPQTTRVILSGQTDQDDLLRDIGCIHHYLQKPCEASVMRVAIERTHLLYNRLSQSKLRIAANQIISLPPSNEVYQALVNELASPAPDIMRVSEIVSKDPAMTAKLMQLVNSAFFGAPRMTTTAHDAVVLLGLKTINSVVVAARIFDFIRDTDQGQMITALWQSSIRIGESARRFAAAAGADMIVQHQAHLAGILSLVGRAILLTSEPAVYAQVFKAHRSTGASLEQCEQQFFGATQDEVAAFALGQWAFADEVVEAVAWQSNPSLCCPVGVSPTLLPFLHQARSSHNPTAGGLDPRTSPDQAFIDQQTFVTQPLCSARTAA